MFRKLMGLLVVVAFVFVVGGLVSTVQAATSDTFQVSFNCNRVVAVVVSTDNTTTDDYEPRIDFGTVNTGSQVIASTCVFVHNMSDANTAAIQNYSVYISTTSGYSYTLNSTTFVGGENEFSIAGIFRPSYPIAGNFNSSGGADDLLATAASPTVWGAAHLNPSTNPYTGSPSTDANVGAHARGDDAARLWLSIQTPTAVSNTTAQTLGLTVIAE